MMLTTLLIIIGRPICLNMYVTVCNYETYFLTYMYYVILPHVLQPV